MNKFLISLGCLVSTICLSQTADYNKTIAEYQNGRISSTELVNILNQAKVETQELSELDILAEQYILSLQSEGEVNANFFPGVDNVIRGFINLIKNEKIKNILGFLFPDNKCDTDLLLKQEGARSIAETFRMAGKEPPVWINKYLVK